jgi:1-acyl-sn-glycerol-3-phosphate acyltransferase
MAARFQPPLRAYHRPWFTGLDHIDPARPSLLVGNHTIFGMLDAPHMLARIYRDRGVYVRSLGDRFHFQIPGWGRFLKSLGVVVGSRENCARLMRSGAQVLVFPAAAARSPSGRARPTSSSGRSGPASREWRSSTATPSRPSPRSGRRSASTSSSMRAT